jgi:hypothetical protein
MENTSGQGPSASVPGEIDKWNWGAFLLNWIWGIGNNTLIALLMFVPFFGFIMAFVLGAKGSAWAWRNRKWDSIEHFKTVQRKWALWALAVYALAVLAAIGIFFAVASALKDSEVYKLALAEIRDNEEIVAITGTPVKAGTPTGSFEESGPNGNASLSFGLSGPKSSGTVFLQARREMGQWQIDKMVFEQDGTGLRIDLSD